jgi:hypothetical protein
VLKKKEEKSGTMAQEGDPKEPQERRKTLFNRQLAKTTTAIIGLAWRW